uniref:Putative basic helix-loop-helix protein At1g06150 n=1 Tax=Anthurium amnicola TaxID=1678845 RepID=A0A1D1ZAX9_9ARAE
MGTVTELRQSLRNLCHGTQWKYAVFWKLKHRSRMLLTWEDGYCVPPKPGDAMEDTSQNGLFNAETGIISFSREMDADGSSAGCPIELAVGNMSCHLYSLGEGIIGKVALTGKHRWIFVKSFNSKVPSEYPEEWQVQFAAGIKTILLVPVVPYGVVQLGSLEMVMEDLKVVAYIKDLFSGLQHADEAHLTLDGDSFNPSSSPSSLLGRNFLAFSAVNVSQPIQSQPQLSTKKDLMIPRLEQMTKNVPNVKSHLSPSFRVQEDLSFTQNEAPHILGMDMGVCVDGNSWKAIYNAISGGVIEESWIGNRSLFSDHSEIIEDAIPSFSTKHKFKGPHQCNTKRSAILYFHDDDLQVGCDCCFVEETIDESLGKVDSEEMNHKASGSYLSFPIDSELHKALGPAFLQEHDSCIGDTSFSGENVLTSSSLACKMEETGAHNLVAAEPSGRFMKQSHAEHLLDAVISSFCTSDESAYNPCSGASPSTSSGQFVDSCLTQIKYEGDRSAVDNSGSRSHTKSFSLPKSEFLRTSPTESQSKSSSMLIDKGLQKGQDYEQLKRHMRTPYVGRRKAKGADVHRPRPRDRQLIQDRIKELRELVPNGSKCSIDALLDRTIKHMLFLQSISSQAENLKQYAHSKVDGENLKPTEAAVQENGASWAYDLGSQTEVCPIVVENLDQPGHMLVEMICNEYGLFLEIAQVIKHLELTILKGVMETRSHKLWAHFIVEASRGFHRMDILWPLMQLLQRHCSPITSAF